MTVQLKQSDDGNTLSFVVGGGSLTWVGSVVALVGVMLTVYLYANWISPDDSLSEAMTTLLIPLATSVFGILLALVRHRLTIRRGISGIHQVTTVGPVPTSTKILPPSKFRSVELETIVQDPSSPEWDLYQISLQFAESDRSMLLWIGSASQQCEAVARQIAEMLNLPLVETDNLRREEEAD